MKSISLLLLRASTGIYLMLWGLLKVVATEKATGVSQKYYSGLLDGQLLNYALGALQITVGLLVVLGLFRAIIYKVQAAWYLLGLLPIMLYIIDPFGLYIADTAKLTFFPSTTLLFASLVMIAFKEYDTLTLDSKRGK
jgi:uncharacterized membrane protein YphA (DoxX/SURF4 family)